MSMIKIHTVYNNGAEEGVIIFFSGTRSIFTNNSYGYYFLMWDTTTLPQLCSRIKKKLPEKFFMSFLLLFIFVYLRHLCVTFPLR